jgi:hypothetical protein
MTTIDSINIIQLHPVRQRTWAVYASHSEHDGCKFFADEIECWALVEHIRLCERWEAPDLCVGEVPCVRETTVRALFLNEMYEYSSDGENLLGHTQTDPATETQRWNKAAEAYFAKLAVPA